MKIVNWQQLDATQQQLVLRRPITTNHDIKAQVQQIIDNVRESGDVALQQYSELFDKVNLDSFKVSTSQLQQATMHVADEIAIKLAYSNIQRFHLAQREDDLSVTTMSGIHCEKLIRPIEKVGLYIPGGSAPLISTVLMLAIPAMIAGCERCIICTPPNSDGVVHDGILYAATLCGIKEVYTVGGAQAIAAMAYGTETIPKVDKIFGPGNSWVTQAKLLVSQDPQGAAIDLPAGPSEVLVIADKAANAKFVAADLLSQAEHGVDSQVVFISDDHDFISEVRNVLQQQLAKLPRKKIAEQALQHSVSILVQNIHQAVDISNRYAPEHLILQVEEPRQYLTQIKSAGSIFLGPWSPEAVGDYASGTNHVLPTYGYAKQYSGLSLRDFCKFISCQQLSREGLFTIAGSVMRLASLEQLEGHNNAVAVRLDEIDDE